MFFVDHDQAQPRHRCEHRQARAEHQIGLAEVRGEPMAQALRRRQATVQRHQVVAGKSLGKSRLELRREVDLGHQDQDLPPCSERLRRSMQVDLGLAATRHTMQQVSRRRVCEKRRDGRCLFG